MDLHEFNPKLLAAIGIVDESGTGHLSRVLGENNHSPFIIDEKRVVLPTAEHLRSDSQSIMIFHPLSENITRGESVMIKSMRDQIMFRLTVIAVQLITELGRVAATDSEHSRLDAASSKYLKVVPDMDVRTYEFLKKIIHRISPAPEKRLISISLRKGSADGVLRAAKFKFPVLEQLLNDDKEILGLKYPSKKARQTLIDLFEFVLGDEETRASYDFGSKNMVAPYFHALLSGFAAIAKHFNDIAKRHKKLFGKAVNDSGEPQGHWAYEDLMTDLSWVEGMEDLGSMRKLLPPQAGNEGAIIVAESKDVERVSSKLNARLAPASRTSGEIEQSREVNNVPFDTTDDRPGVRNVPREESVKRKSLDDVLRGNRRDRDDRDDRYSRDGRRDRDDRYGRDDRRDAPRTRHYSLGRDDDDRDDRYGRDDRRDRDDRGGRSGRDFGRDTRTRGRAFGSGVSSYGRR